VLRRGPLGGMLSREKKTLLFLLPFSRMSCVVSTASTGVKLSTFRSSPPGGCQKRVYFVGCFLTKFYSLDTRKFSVFFFHCLIQSLEKHNASIVENGCTKVNLH
jgi:hypothetical protein